MAKGITRSTGPKPCGRKVLCPASGLTSQSLAGSNPPVANAVMTKIARIASEMIEIVDHRTGPFEHHRAECGGQHAARRALEKRHAEHALQFRQRIRYRWLTAGHMLRDARQRTVLLDLQQQHQMPHLQARAQPPDHVVRLKCH